MVRALTTLAGALLVLAVVPGAGRSQESTDAGFGAWQGTVLSQTLGDARVVGVAVEQDLMVAVGQRACVTETKAGARCWGQSWTSTDGITWNAADPRTSGLALGRLYPILSGPEIGLQGVTIGPAGFLAFGRIETDELMGQRSAVWRSDDGVSWERLSNASTFPAGARLRTILGADDGYLLGGVTYRDKAPRAAIWSSPDGRTWTQAHGSDGAQTFEIGGYIDTLEDPGSGGVNAFAPYPGSADGSARLLNGVVAVGQACMPSLDRDPWAWNGACWGQLWRSDDGTTWRKDDGTMPRPNGAVRHAASIAEQLVVDAPICLDRCASALLLTNDGTTWQVGYGSPVGGTLEALVAQAGQFHALLVSEASDASDAGTLVLWASRDGTNWMLQESQPTLPVPVVSFEDVDMAVADTRLVVTASVETAPDGDVASIVMVSPQLPTGIVAP